MTRSPTLTEDDLHAVAREVALADESADNPAGASEQARARVDADIASAEASGVLMTPTFFVNGRRYEGVWDRAALAEALHGTLSHRVRSAALEFARWAPSAGLLLLIATGIAVILTNSPAAAGFARFWGQTLGVTFAGRVFQLPLLQWVNDGLLTVFFLVVNRHLQGLWLSPIAAHNAVGLSLAGTL